MINFVVLVVVVVVVPASDITVFFCPYMKSNKAWRVSL